MHGVVGCLRETVGCNVRLYGGEVEELDGIVKCGNENNDKSHDMDTDNVSLNGNP